MKLMILLVAAILLSGASVHATGESIIIVHGWDYNNQGQTLWDDVYGELEASLVADGYDVHGPLLPKNGNTAGDSIANAESLKQYIETNNLSNVTLVCHSLGGVVCEYYVRLLNEGEIGKYILLDTNIVTEGVSGWKCTFGPPDQCTGSAVRNAIFGAPESGLHLMYIYSTINGYEIPVDCRKYVFSTHGEMPSHPSTIQHIKQGC